VPRVPIGDAFIHYEEQGSGPPLLLVPGLSGLGSFCAPQVVDFARDFRVMTHRPGEYNAAVGTFLREHRAL